MSVEHFQSDTLQVTTGHSVVSPSITTDGLVAIILDESFMIELLSHPFESYIYSF